MNDMIDALVKKLIEDTKANKIKWHKPKYFEEYAIDRAKYYTNIAEIGDITISKTEDDEIYFNITEKDIAKDSDNINLNIDYNSDYYVNMMRLYNLANGTYMKRISNGSLGQAITAYINRPN